MAAKKVGTLIKEARTGADMTQEQLARRIKGLSAADISLAERGQKDLTQAQLKEIAKVTGVTQASLINAAKDAAPKAAAKKTTSAVKKATATKKTTSSSQTSIKVTAAEKKLIELYREADAETRKEVVNLLKGETSSGSADSILEGIQLRRGGLHGLLIGKTTQSEWRTLLGEPESSLSMTQSMAFDYGLCEGSFDVYQFGGNELRLYADLDGVLFAIQLCN